MMPSIWRLRKSAPLDYIADNAEFFEFEELANFA